MKGSNTLNRVLNAHVIDEACSVIYLATIVHFFTHPWFLERRVLTVQRQCFDLQNLQVNLGVVGQRAHQSLIFAYLFASTPGPVV